ncbi:MAG: hypothetical protein K2W96_27225 [Gemmataceae bacterium]|nr:hypothetical protein [Gemmataceae bacterium]
MIRQPFALLLASLAMWAAPPPVWSQGDPFPHLRRTLEYDQAKNKKKELELSLRKDALTRQNDKLNQRSKEIEAMPAGIGRDAALAGFKRDK